MDTPLYFGSRSRRLFGLYRAPSGPTTKGAPSGVLLCQPIGREYLRAHRSLRQLANLLASQGHHVLRFDYFGTGDSAGDASDTDLDGMGSDVNIAAEELREISGSRTIAVAGLRIGATLAAGYAASNPRQVRAVVLWDPVIRGDEYLRDLLATADSMEHPAEKPHRRSSAAGGGIELLGWVMPQASYEQIARASLENFLASPPARTLALISESGPPIPPEAATAQDPERRLHWERYHDPHPWAEVPSSMTGEIPSRAIARIAAFLARSQ